MKIQEGMRGKGLSYFSKNMFRYSIWFLVELIMTYVLAAVVVKGNTLIGSAIDQMLEESNVDIVAFMGTLLVMTALGFILAFIKSIAASKFSIAVQTRYKSQVAKKLYALEYQYFDENGSATVINKMNSDIGEVDTFLNEQLPTLCTSFISIIVYSVYIGTMNFSLLLLMFLCYPIVLFLSDRFARKTVALTKIHRQKADRIMQISQDSISGILVLRTFGAENYFQKQLDKAADEIVEYEGRRVRITNTASLIRKMMQWMPNIICAIYAYVLVCHGNLSIGSLMAFIVVLGRFVDAFVGLPFDVIEARESIVCIRRIENILRQKEEHGGDYLGDNQEVCQSGSQEGSQEACQSGGQEANQEACQSGSQEDNQEACQSGGQEGSQKNIETAISFENVSFSYIKDNPILNHLSFQIKRGETTAFVGESGGGKSTIFHLLCGFYPVESGSYRLFGTEFKQWDLEAARERIGLVSQNVFLFPSTIRDNIAYAKTYASETEIIEACKNARIHDFIMGLPDGYDTMVGERGVLLSGGERQRISIARAILKDAPLLLLDEPTSAVDVATERLIQDAIDHITKNRTCIIIAHRLSTIENADRIMVLKDGSVAETGTHKQLLEAGGIYAGMYGCEERTRTQGKAGSREDSASIVAEQNNQEVMA